MPAGTGTKKDQILKRIESLENSIAKAKEYLESGEHSEWHEFRPVFGDKIKEGKIVPPHRKWVKNVFLPARERALSKAEKILDSFE